MIADPWPFWCEIDALIQMMSREKMSQIPYLLSKSKNKKPFILMTREKWFLFIKRFFVWKAIKKIKWSARSFTKIPKQWNDDRDPRWPNLLFYLSLNANNLLFKWDVIYYFKIWLFLKIHLFGLFIFYLRQFNLLQF